MQEDLGRSSLVSSKVQSDEETQVSLNFALLITGPWPQWFDEPGSRVS